MRIGIDVGGTHTDAVLMAGAKLLGSHKALTTPEPGQGILAAMDAVLRDAGINATALDSVMVGTTHFTNAVVERRQLAETAIIRAALPTGSGVPPKCDWPADIAAAVGDHCYMIGGGHLFNGQPIAELDEPALALAIADIARKGLQSVAVAAAFSPAVAAHELRMAELIRERIPRAKVSLSHELGRLGILERENAALLNAALGDLAERFVSSMQSALARRQIRCPLYISQNDGTLMTAEYIARYPALTFASGPTNSLRGAAMLSGLLDAIVVDIGGTTADVGVLANGFPRESNSHIEVGGVRTNFRMPDILSIGLGGGSLVSQNGTAIGPQSVGHQLVQQGLVFGGDTLTATDIAVANGAGGIGQPSRVAHLPEALVETATATIQRMIDDAVDRMRPTASPQPVILVGGGAVLVSRPLQTASTLLQPQHGDVANAIGAAIAQAGGEAEQLVSYAQTSRQQALAQVTVQARHRAVAAGAEANSLRVLDVEETTISYLEEDAARIRIKVVGDLQREP